MRKQVLETVKMRSSCLSSTLVFRYIHVGWLSTQHVRKRFYMEGEGVPYDSYSCSHDALLSAPWENVFGCVSLAVCRQNYSKTYRWIFMNFFLPQEGTGQRNTLLNVGDDHDRDLGIFWKVLHYCRIEALAEVSECF